MPNMNLEDYINAMIAETARSAALHIDRLIMGIPEPPKMPPTAPRVDRYYQGHIDAPEFEGAKITFAQYGEAIFWHGNPPSEPPGMILDHDDILRHKPVKPAGLLEEGTQDND